MFGFALALAAAPVVANLDQMVTCLAYYRSNLDAMKSLGQEDPGTDTTWATGLFNHAVSAGAAQGLTQAQINAQIAAKIAGQMPNGMNAQQLQQFAFCKANVS